MTLAVRWAAGKECEQNIGLSVLSLRALGASVSGSAQGARKAVRSARSIKVPEFQNNPYKLIMMKCPVTGKAVHTRSNSAYFETWGDKPPAGGASFACRECGQTHKFDKTNTWLQSPRRPVMDRGTSATLIIPVCKETDDTLLATLKSLVEFRSDAYSEPDDCQIICVGDIPNATKLREYGTNNYLSPDYVYPMSDWDEMERESGMPMAAASLNAAAARVMHGAVVLMAPGTKVASPPAAGLSSAIQAVYSDPNLLMISNREDAKHCQLGSAAFSMRGFEQNGIALCASDGIPTVCEKKLFGGFKFSKTTEKVEEDVQWLISTIGFHYQETSGLKLRFDSWT